MKFILNPTACFTIKCERCVVACRKIAQGCASGRTEAVPPDDAASSPHQSDGAVVEGPAEFFGRLSQQHETLCVGNDLGCIKSLQTCEQSAPISELSSPATGDPLFFYVFYLSDVLQEHSLVTLEFDPLRP